MYVKVQCFLMGVRTISALPNFVSITILDLLHLALYFSITIYQNNNKLHHIFKNVSIMLLQSITAIKNFVSNVTEDLTKTRCFLSICFLRSLEFLTLYSQSRHYHLLRCSLIQKAVSWKFTYLTYLTYPYLSKPIQPIQFLKKEHAVVYLSLPIHTYLTYQVSETRTCCCLPINTYHYRSIPIRTYQ